MFFFRFQVRTAAIMKMMFFQDIVLKTESLNNSETSVNSTNLQGAISLKTLVFK
jgi:hypothetical protein